MPAGQLRVAYRGDARRRRRAHDHATVDALLRDPNAEILAFARAAGLPLSLVPKLATFVSALADRQRTWTIDGAGP